MSYGKRGTDMADPQPTLGLGRIGVHHGATRVPESLASERPMS